MDGMPAPAQRYLQKHVTRHGKIRWCVRIGHGPRTWLTGEYGSAEFWAQYHDAASKRANPAAPRKRSGSLSWLLARYFESSAWLNLSRATRAQRGAIFRRVEATAGDAAYVDIDRTTIIDGRERRAAQPNAARHFVDAMRGLFRWAVDCEYVATDPTRDVRVAKPKTDGFHTWTDEEIARFEARWQTGTRERLAFDILLYTGLRRGDAAALGRQHVRHGRITIKTAKTGEIVSIPLLPALAASIAATKAGGLALVAAADGSPLTKESFGNWFAEACMAAGVPGRAHGLRKAGATRAADNGATEAELEAMYGWRGGRMASLYTRAADRVRLAERAAKMLAGGNEQGSPTPTPTKTRAHT